MADTDARWVLALPSPCESLDSVRSRRHTVFSSKPPRDFPAGTPHRSRSDQGVEFGGDQRATEAGWNDPVAHPESLHSGGIVELIVPRGITNCGTPAERACAVVPIPP